MKNGKHEAKNAVIILSPFDALNVLALLEKCEEMHGRRLNLDEELLKTIDNYRRQINENLTAEQVEDATAQQCAKKLIKQVLKNLN